MRRRFGLTLLVMAVVCMMAASSAHARMSIPQQVDQLQTRINSGVAKGQLSRQEAATLQENLDWVKHRFNRMTADGLLTPGERANMEKTLGKISSMIYKKKHNPIGPIYGPALQSRIAEQQSRINNGIKSRKLNRREAAVVQDNLNWIKRRLARSIADGRLTASERDRLEAMLDQNSKMIFREKHDGFRRLY